MTSADQLSSLAKGWIWTQIQDISETTSGGTPSRKNKGFFSGNIPWLKSGELADNPTIYSAEESITQQALDNSSAKIMPSGTLLVALYGATVGKLGLLGIEAAINQAICAIQPYPGVNPKYLFWYLNSYRRNFLNARKGGAQPNISQEIVRTTFVPLAPTSEQLRIIARIEELFSFLDAGVESLQKVKAQLRRFRQVVLKYAFEGKLTEEWRKTHRNQVEPAQKLLEQMEQERLEKCKRRKKPISLDASTLPKLPEGWAWTNFEGLAEDSPNAIKAGPFGSTLKKKFYVATGFKIYGQEQVIRDDAFYGDYYIDEERYKKLESCAVKPGDILISLVGTIGKVLILPDEIEQGIINPRLVKLTLNKRLINPKYVKAYFMSSAVKGYFSLSSHGGTMDILNLSILKILPVVLPPLKEQEAIIEELERTFSLSDDLENAVDENVRRAEKLRESILKNAFEGNLVPQDPSEEPAEKLLERIKTERFKNKKSKVNKLELSRYVK